MRQKKLPESSKISWAGKQIPSIWSAQGGSFHIGRSQSHFSLQHQYFDGNTTRENKETYQFFSNLYYLRFVSSRRECNVVFGVYIRESLFR